MSQNTPNPNPRKSSPPIVHAPRHPMDVPAPEAAVDEAMLFEATEAFIRAFVREDPKAGESAAIAGALASEELAPFDAPAVYQAIDFLRRLGYLSDVAQGEGGREAA